MLPKKNRLILSKIKPAGRRLETTLASFIIARDNEGSFRAAVTVSKKIAPKAHDRNRIRRLFYEALAKHKHTSGLQIVIRAKKNLAQMKMYQVENITDKVLKKND